MPPIHGSKARLLLSGRDVSGSMRAASTPMEVDVAESSTWGMTNKRYTSSDRVEGSLNGSGVWESGLAGAGSIDELLDTSLAGLHVASFLPGGDGFGKVARIIGGTEEAFEITSPGDEVVAFSFELASERGFLKRGRVLQPLAGALNIAAGGNGASFDDLGAAGTTTKGAAGALHVINKGGGAGTLTVKVQHSVDQAVWVDLITFTGRTVANVAEYLEVAGTVQRYLRALWTLTGGTWDIHVAAGRK